MYVVVIGDGYTMVLPKDYILAGMFQDNRCTQNLKISDSKCQIQGLRVEKPFVCCFLFPLVFFPLMTYVKVQYAVDHKV